MRGKGMAEERKSRKTATEAAAKVPKMVKANILGNLKAKEEGKPVAYCFIVNGYDEILRAMDIAPAWVESYSGVCAAKRDAERFLRKAESENFSRSLCTYATCGLGFDIWRKELNGEMPPDAPWGGLAKPDIILGSGQMLCDPRYKWPQATQHYLQGVPAYVGGFYWPPFDRNVDHKEVEEYYVKYAVKGLRGAVAFIEKHTQRRMDWDRLEELIDLVDRTWNLFIEAYELRKAIPTPMDTGDAMNTMVPLAFMLGTQEAYDFYKDLYDELKRKNERKEGVAANEKYRLLWGAGLPSWFALADFQYFNSQGAVFPVERTYREAEPIDRLELPKMKDPLEHIARRWIRYWTHWYDRAKHRPGSIPEVERLIEYIEDYKIDGVVFHQAFSCRTWHSGIIMQAQILKKIYGEIPILMMEGDIVDISSYNEEDTHHRIDVFIEAMEAVKSKR
jgi:benzoyl-CoA reductase/2-hydroxyglutaryl-CoA dehydratase subunit BcrC/BadD/HgdB